MKRTMLHYSYRGLTAYLNKGGVNIKRFYKIDCAIEDGFKWVSYISCILTLIIALAVTVNIISTKLFSWSVPSANDWVSYLFCGMFYFAIGYVRLTQGLIAVDIISQHFSTVLTNIVTVFGDLAALVLYGMIGWYAVPLAKNNYAFHITTSFGKGAFQIWPFNVIVMVFSFLFAFTMLWHIVRLFVYRQNGERPRDWYRETDKQPGTKEGKA